MEETEVTKELLNRDAELLRAEKLLNLSMGYITAVSFIDEFTFEQARLHLRNLECLMRGGDPHLLPDFPAIDVKKFCEWYRKKEGAQHLKS